jgi:hypothetical protein
MPCSSAGRPPDKNTISYPHWGRLAHAIGRGARCIASSWGPRGESRAGKGAANEGWVVLWALSFAQSSMVSSLLCALLIISTHESGSRR